MNNEKLSRILRAVGRLDRPSTPHNHSLKQPGDPTLAEFMAALEKGFSEEQRRQWADSAYCTRLMKLRYRQAPPSVETLVRFQAGQVHGFEEAALREYLEEPEGRSTRLLFQSPTLTEWARGLVSAAGEHAANILQWARQALHSGGAIPASMALAMGECSTSEPEEPFLVQAANSDGALDATLWQTAEGKLELDVSTADPRRAGKTVWVEILGENGPLKDERLKQGILLKALPEGRGAAGEYVFGEPFAEIAPKLGCNCALLLLPESRYPPLGASTIDTSNLGTVEPWSNRSDQPDPGPLLAMALQSPGATRLPVDVPRTEFEIQFKDCHWMPVIPTNLTTEVASVRLNTLPTGVLQVACDGFLRVKKDAMLEVVWIAADGVEHARGTNPNPFSSVVELRGPAGTRPQKSDRIQIRLSRVSTPVEMGWTVEVELTL